MKNDFKAYVQSVTNGNKRFLHEYQIDTSLSRPFFSVLVPWPIFYEIYQLSRFPANHYGEVISHIELVMKIFQAFIMTADEQTLAKEYTSNKNLNEIYNLNDIENNKMASGWHLSNTGRYLLRFNLYYSGTLPETKKKLFDALKKIAYGTSPGGVGDMIYTRTYIVCMALASFLDDYSQAKNKIKTLSDALNMWTANGFQRAKK